MATSDRYGLPKRQDESALAIESLTRYDLVLAIIPSVFLMSLLVGQTLSISMPTVLLGAGLVGVLTVTDALFLNPPNGSQ
jgi:hypothetical protein